MCELVHRLLFLKFPLTEAPFIHQKSRIKNLEVNLYLQKLLRNSFHLLVCREEEFSAITMPQGEVILDLLWGLEHK